MQSNGSEAYMMLLTLAETGVDDPMPFILVGGGLLAAGAIALVIRGVMRTRKRR